ncbi:MAG: hypothetical protein INR63_05360 [Actinomycetospora chiangmaiensis]|nr:hypothetical protein [Actinomycetospora chiangmaiensis]
MRRIYTGSTREARTFTTRRQIRRDRIGAIRNWRPSRDEHRRVIGAISTRFGAALRYYRSASDRTHPATT